MPVYITLWKYTRDGLVDIGNTKSRFEAVRRIIEKNGGKLVSIYGLMGEYDVLTIMEMPSRSAMVSTVMKVCASGRISAQTLPALSIEEFLEITSEV